MATIKRFEDLDVWKLAKELCEETGKIIDRGAFGKNFRLINQIEGSSGSIMDNIAEGFERGVRKEFIQFLGYSKGSAGEYRSQLYRAFNRIYITQDEFDNLLGMVMRISGMLKSFIQYLQKTTIEGVRKLQPLNP
ncbi:MAG TPA: four helix bundle protein [Chitinophagaceae bacterium]|jgi:four helix bundle protein|nr:four helix bundle protein [Chitinophagaceae bacterium]